jgi:TPR repeat protein
MACASSTNSMSMTLREEKKDPFLFDCAADIIQALISAGDEALDCKTEDKIIRSIQAMIARKLPNLSDEIALVQALVKKSSVHQHNKPLTKVLSTPLVLVVVPSSGKKAHDHQAAIKNGDHSAYAKLAECYEEGTGGVEVDFVRAFELYSQAASIAQDISAMYKISHMFESGIGIAKNTKKSEEWLTKAGDTANEQEFAQRRAMMMAAHGPSPSSSSAGHSGAGHTSGMFEKWANRLKSSNVNVNGQDSSDESSTSSSMPSMHLEKIRGFEKSREELRRKKHTTEMAIEVCLDMINGKKKDEYFVMLSQLYMVVDMLLLCLNSYTSAQTVYKKCESYVGVTDFVEYFNFPQKLEALNRTMKDVRLDMIYFSLGLMLENGKSDEKARFWYRQSLEFEESNIVIFHYARLELKDEYKNKTRASSAIAMLEKAAGAGAGASTEAMNLLGDIYKGTMFPGAVVKNEDEAVKWLLKAHALGKLDSQHWLFLASKMGPLPDMEFFDLETKRDNAALWKIGETLNVALEKALLPEEKLFYKSAIQEVFKKLQE